MTSPVKICATLLMNFLILSCGDERGGGSLISNSASLISSQYSSFQANAVDPCQAAETSCTPSSFSGQVYAASAMIGEAENGGLGEGAYAMTFLADDEEVINRPDLGKKGSLTFDLTDASVFSGLISIPSEDNFPSSPYMPRVEIAYDYLDAGFTLAGHGTGAMNDSWTIRTVFVNSVTIDGLEVQGGDLLLRKGSGDWQWCDGTGCSTTRPDSPHQLATVVEALAEAAGADGNENYAYYSVDFESALTPSYAELSDTTRLWTLDFDVTNAIGWSAAPTGFTAEEDFLANFELPYSCNYNGCPEAEGIGATLTIGEAGTATAVP